jgi:3-oxoacyl-[acyl-carrier protein] reductase
MDKLAPEQGWASLEGRRVLVVGAAHGIGQAAAMEFGRRGARLVVADLDDADVGAVARELAALGTDATAVGVDVTSEESVARMHASSVAALGGIDVLLHAAGIGGASPVGELTLDAWDRMITTNLTGPFLVTRSVVDGMVAQGSGRIVIISSQLAFRGAAGLAHYCAAKAGIHGFVKAVAREVAASGVTVNAIAPGPTDTALLRALPDEVISGVLDEVPLGRVAHVDEIVPTAVLLASDAGSYYTGAILSPSGGHVMH